MKWSEIRKLHPDKFVLIGDLLEENISALTKIEESK